MTEAYYRKEETFDVLKHSIDKKIDEAVDEGSFEVWWDIPKKIVDNHRYDFLVPLIEKYKKRGYIVEFDNTYHSKDHDATQIYFNWF